VALAIHLSGVKFKVRQLERFCPLFTSNIQPLSSGAFIVLLDFSPVNDGQIKLYDFAQALSIDDLRSATNASLDAILGWLGGADDAQMIFIPNDPDADDEHAPPEERYQGWSLAHLVVHVTATSEESAAYSAILARGVPYPREPRLRYETDWHVVKTRAAGVQRREECRRMRLAALDMWPDVPHLDVLREVSANYVARLGVSNAKSAILSGLKHEHAHHAQIQATALQACEALAPAGTC
jgi:hypothetical protein